MNEKEAAGKSFIFERESGCRKIVIFERESGCRKIVHFLNCTTIFLTDTDFLLLFGTFYDIMSDIWNFCVFFSSNKLILKCYYKSFVHILMWTGGIYGRTYYSNKKRNKNI